MTSLLKIRDLVVERGGKSVLTIKELDIQSGDILAVVGPNGAGKSTLLLTLARLLHQSRGEIFFNGKQARAESDTFYRRRIALVLQDPLLFDMSVFDNISSGLRFRGIEKKVYQPWVESWLERLGILDLKGRRATELSGGEAQRVSLARALVLEPELLLLDEPFSALDPPTHKRLLGELGAVLSETRTTTVFITHDMQEALQLGKQMAVIVKGELRKAGKPEEILLDLNDPELIEFLQQ